MGVSTLQYPGQGPRAHRRQCEYANTEEVPHHHRSLRALRQGRAFPGGGRRADHAGVASPRMDMIIRASTERGGVVWEPFGGLCPGAVVSRRLGRKYHAAEPISEF